MVDTEKPIEMMTNRRTALLKTLPFFDLAPDNYKASLGRGGKPSELAEVSALLGIWKLTPLGPVFHVFQTPHPSVGSLAASLACVVDASRQVESSQYAC